VISSPAIGVDSTLYVGSDDYHLYAVNTVDGSIKWSFKTGNVRPPDLWDFNMTAASRNSGKAHKLRWLKIRRQWLASCQPAG
jgi:outer membrane protein assembly factor BamB